MLNIHSPYAHTCLSVTQTVRAGSITRSKLISSHAHPPHSYCRGVPFGVAEGVAAAGLERSPRDGDWKSQLDPAGGAEKRAGAASRSLGAVVGRAQQIITDTIDGWEGQL